MSGKDGLVPVRPVLVEVDAVGDDADTVVGDAVEVVNVPRIASDTATTPSAFWYAVFSSQVLAL